MSPLRPVNRSTRLDLYRRAEKVLLSQTRPHWLGTRRGLKRIVRRYVRQYGEASGLRGLLRSGALAAATALFLLQLYATPVEAALFPAFGASSTNPFGLTDVGSHSRQTFADLDGDGDLDLMSGELNGSFFYLENTGSSSAPAFGASSTNPFGLGSVGNILSSPVFADLDGDGDLDMFSGEGDGGFFYFANTGSSSAPAFAASVTDPFGLADIGYNSRPVFMDLDGDGDLDLLSGELNGNFFYFENTGSSNAPAFAASSTNPFGLAGIGYYQSIPAFADLDGDGDLDMFSGSDPGNFFYFENTGSSNAPAFAASSTNPFGLAGVGGNSSPAFADLDGDGNMDLISGNNYGNFVYFENVTPPPVPVVLALGVDLGAPGETLRISTRITNPTSDPVGGLQFFVLLDNPSVAHFTEVEEGSVISDFTISASTINDSTSLLIYSTSGAVIQPGTDIHLATLLYRLDPAAVLGSTISLTSADLEIGDPFGDELPDSASTGQLQVDIRGDVNIDGRVTIFDIVQLVRIILGQDAAPADSSRAFSIADANRSGGIDIADVLTQVNRFLGITQPSGKAVAGAPVTVSLGTIQVTDDGRSVIPVYLSDSGSIVGAQGVLQFDPSVVEIGTPQLAAPRDGLYVDSFVKDGTLRFVVYDTHRDGRIAQPDEPMLLIPVSGVTDEQSAVALSGVRIVNRSAQSVPVTAGTMTVSLSYNAGAPLSFGLNPAAPNPFNPATSIAYDVPKQAHITLTVYNLLGQEITRLVDGAQSPGRYQVAWNGRNARGQSVASGVYLYRITSDTGFTQVQRMTLLK